MHLRVKETVTEALTERGPSAGGLYHANQVAAFDYSERQATLAARIMNCITRAFYAIGMGSQTQEVIFWNLYVTQNIGRDEIMDKPTQFIEGVKAIFGEAGTVVFEHMLIREIKLELGVPADFDMERDNERRASDLLSSIVHAELGSPDNP